MSRHQKNPPPSCACCGAEGPTYLRQVTKARCHPDAPQWLLYHRNGTLSFACGFCKREITRRFEIPKEKGRGRGSEVLPSDLVR